MIHAFCSAALSVILAVVPMGSNISVPTRADQIRQQQWMLDYLDIARVHEISTGTGVVVGLPDTGVDPHPDLAKSLLPGFDLVGGGRNGQDDTDGHGTAMAGLIAGQGHSGNAGVMGVAPSAKVLPIIAAKTYGGTTTIAEGIELAIKQGAQVVNVSSGSPKSLTLQRAIRTAAQADVLIVAANGNTTKTFSDRYPASLPGVLAVGAIDKTGRHANISFPGGNIGICAPGVDVVSTGRDGKYVTTDGTSSATAIVSGAAALVRAKFPDLSAAEVMHRLTATADDIGPAGRDDQCGYGVLNIGKALTAEVPALTTTTPANSARPVDSPAPAGAAPGSERAGPRISLVAGLGAAFLVVLLVALVVRRRRARS